MSVMMEPVVARVDVHVATGRMPGSGVVVERFEAFYARDYSAVVGLARVLTGDRVVAEDLAQEAFVAAYRRWAKIGGYDDPGAWVRRAVLGDHVPASCHRRSKSKG